MLARAVPRPTTLVALVVEVELETSPRRAVPTADLTVELLALRPEKAARTWELFIVISSRDHKDSTRKVALL